ncbi:MAG: hypothetical protein A2Y15_07455 [Clostridiales bacterium GWF2_36_10]|nr:MAG: hypothetical protein A2Y15_07455 [Clostridiales bacterium GWF2_36_10]
MFYRILRIFLIPFVKILFFIKVTGQENEPKTNYITCANHSSFADPAFIAYALKRTQRFVARSTLIRFRFFSWLFNHVRVITINRGKSDIQAIKTIVSAIKDDDSVCIFPQGTRVRGVMPRTEQAEAGLGLIVSMTEMPVLPVSIITKRLYPGFFRRTEVVIGKPIKAEEYLNCKDNPRKKDISEYCFSFVCKPFEGRIFNIKSDGVKFEK